MYFSLSIWQISGLYPLVGWRVGDDLAYVAEGASNDNGTLINWAVKCGKLVMVQINLYYYN
jgi:putative glycerol kinase 5